MEKPTTTIVKLRTLATAQVTDEAWLSAARESTRLDASTVTIKRWMEEFDLNKMGKVKKVTIDEKEGIQWDRPDEGMPMFIVSDVPDHIILTRYILFAGLIAALKNAGEASFMKVGMMGWTKCKVYFNGQEASQVISADAILNTIEFYVRDKDGKHILSDDKINLESRKLSGIVRIVIAEQQTFF